MSVRIDEQNDLLELLTRVERVLWEHDLEPALAEEIHDIIGRRSEDALYCIVRVRDGVPVSSWTTDRKHLDEYLAERPEGVEQQIVVSNSTTLPDEEVSLADLDNTDCIHVELTDGDKKMLDKYAANVAAALDTAEAKGLVPLVPKEEAHKYEDNTDSNGLRFGQTREEFEVEN